MAAHLPPHQLVRPLLLGVRPPVHRLAHLRDRLLVWRLSIRNLLRLIRDPSRDFRSRLGEARQLAS